MKEPQMNSMKMKGEKKIKKVRKKMWGEKEDFDFKFDSMLVS